MKRLQNIAQVRLSGNPQKDLDTLKNLVQKEFDHVYSQSTATETITKTTTVVKQATTSTQLPFQYRIGKTSERIALGNSLTPADAGKYMFFDVEAQSPYWWGGTQWV